MQIHSVTYAYQYRYRYAYIITRQFKERYIFIQKKQRKYESLKIKFDELEFGFESKLLKKI